jgi:uncharacterized protein YjbJ (UPF0337 family)
MPHTNKSERIDGKFEEVGGNLKKNIGHIIGNDKMENEGRVTEMKGQARQAFAETGDKIEGVFKEAAGAVENRIGLLVSNEAMQLEGKAKHLEGKNLQKEHK